MSNNSAETYTTFSKLIHWLAALLIFVLLAVGFFMADLPKDDPSLGKIYGMHKSFGILVFLLLVIRILWLRINPAPALPAVFTDKEKKVIRSVKGILYLLMFLVPISGYVMSMAAGRETTFFRLFTLPMFIGEDKALGGLAHIAHELLAIGIIAFVLLHLAGAIKHRLKDRNGPSDILNRML